MKTPENENVVSQESGQEQPDNPIDVTAEDTGGEQAVETETGTGEGTAGQVSAEEVERLVAEAEQRGYLRGRNEHAREMMGRPALLENPLVRATADRVRDEGETFASRFLSRLPREVWD